MTCAPVKKQSSWDTLNDKQKLFVLSYIQNGFNSSLAYKNSYKIESDDTARAASARLLAKVNVKQAVQEKLDSIWNEKEQFISRTLSEILTLSFSDISQIVDIKNGHLIVKDLNNVDTRIIQSIRTTRTAENETITVTLHNKIQSLSLLSKILNMVSDKIEMSGTIEIIPAVRPKSISEQRGLQ